MRNADLRNTDVWKLRMAREVAAQYGMEVAGEEAAELGLGWVESMQLVRARGTFESPITGYGVTPRREAVELAVARGIEQSFLAALEVSE